MEFWQNIVLKWKQIQQFCLWALSSDPSGIVESGLYYNTTANRAALRDDTKTQFLAHLEDTYKNAGVVKQPTITKGAGSVTVGNDAVIRCYKTTDYSGIIQEVVNPVGGTFALTENTPLWLVYTYGVGYSVQTSITGPISNAIPVYRFFNAFGVIHSSTQDEMGVGATEKILVKQTRTEYIKRVGDSGIELSTSALNVLISGGLAYNGPILETIRPFNSTTNNLYRVVYDDGVWSQTTLHALTNTHYNPSTGLAALNSNKYCWAYVWRSIGDDVEALFQLGEQEYATEALAVADIGKMPSNIYGLYATHCVLVGYVLIKQGVTTTQYFSAWGRPTVAGAPVYHNTLAGIDAGDPGTAYLGHVKLIDNTRMNAAGAANGYALLGADGKLPSGQLPSYVDDVLEYAAKANFPATGENGRIYVDLTTNLTWRWSGTTYVEISPSLALGETSATAYRGDRGKTAYDHSQLTASNPHGTTAAQIASAATGDVSATNVQAAIAELASEKLSTTTASTTYAPINTTLADNAASSTLPATASGSLVSKIQQARDYLKYLLQQIGTKQDTLTFDNAPTDGSANPVRSNGVYDALSAKVPITKNYWSASYLGNDYRYVKIASITTSDSDYTTHCLFIGKSFYNGMHLLQGMLYIAQNGFGTGSVPVLTFIGQSENAKLVYTFDDTTNLLEIYLHCSSGTGPGLVKGFTTNIITSTDPSRITLLTSGDPVTSVTGAINVNRAWITTDGCTHLVAPPTSADDDAAVTSAWVKDVAQPVDAGLIALAAKTTTGLMVQTEADAYTARSLANGTGTTVTNGSGVGGNPAVNVTYGATANTACQGNDVRLSDARTPTYHASTANTYGVANASKFGHTMASSANPLMDGTASAGTDNGKYTREGHVHPTDNTKMTAPKNFIGVLSTSQTITPTDGDFYLIDGSGLTITLSNSAQALSNVYLIYNATCGYSQHAIQFYDFSGNLKVLKTRPYTGTVENSTIIARKGLNGWMVTGY